MFSTPARRALIECTRHGDRAARNELLLLCLPLVDEVLRRLARRHRRADLEDARQDACVALLESLPRYDPARHGPLESFVRWRAADAALGSIAREYRHGVTFGRAVDRGVMGVAREYHRLSVSLGRPPTVDELIACGRLPRALVTGTPKTVRRRLIGILSLVQGPVELDSDPKATIPAPRSTEEEALDHVAHEELAGAIGAALAGLAPQQRAVLESCYLADVAHGEREAGAGELDLSAHQAYRARDRAVRRLRAAETLRELAEQRLC